jgi:oxaloacetate decarboxylase alpha subunit
MAANGIKRVQLHEINDFGFRLSQNVQFARDAGLKVVLALIYSHSPKHTNEYYAKKAQEAMKLKPDIIYLKDPGGLLTPERTKTLIPVIFQNINGMPFELHSHCTTGLAPLCYLEAIRLGVKTLHTCIPPLANSSAQPSMVNIASNARFMGYTPTITDEEAIEPITAHFRYIARREGLPIGAPVEYNAYQYMHQVPGGVISTLREQLTRIKMQHRLGEVLEETIQVRKDLGYPVMVTPFSQHVVTQATINVMLGERYKEVIEELIQYAVGFWGEEAKSAIEPNLMDRIMSLPRAKEIANWEPPEPSIKEMRQKYGGPGISDEELLLRYMGREEELEAVRAAGPIKEYPSTRTPLLALIRELTKQKDSNYISIQKGELSLTIQKY